VHTYYLQKPSFRKETKASPNTLSEKLKVPLGSSKGICANSQNDSNEKEKEKGACFLAPHIWTRWVCGIFRMGLRKSDKFACA